MTNVNFNDLKKNEINNIRIEKYLKYLDILSNSLNKIHKADFKSSYWEIIIGPWLLFFISTNDTNCSCQKKNKKLNNATYPKDRDLLRIPYDFASYINLTYQNNYFNSLEDFTVGENNKFATNAFKYTIKKNNLRNFLNSINIKLSKIILKYFSIVAIDTYLPIEQRIKLFIKSKFRIFPISLYDNEVSNNTNINFDIRKNLLKNELDKIAIEDQLDKLLIKIIPYQIPYVYIEGYKDLIRKLPKSNKKLKVIYTSVGLFQNELFKLFCAQNKIKNNTKLVGSQHGGFPYGMSDSPMPYLEKKIVDRYLTWGWSDGENDIKFISLKISHLRKFIEKKRIVKNDNLALYISTCGSKSDPNNWSVISGNEWINYYDDQSRFFDNLNQDLYKKILIRLHPSDKVFDFPQKKNFLKINKSFNFDRNINYAYTLLKTKLVIIDHLHTTFLETIAFNIPTIVFIDEKSWIPNDKFLKIYKKLKDVQIIHTSPISASKFINNNFNTIDQWWNSLEVKEVVFELKNSFINLSINPEKKLINYLDKLKK